GQHSLPVEEHRARAAGSLVAALLRADQLEMISKRIEQRHSALETQPAITPVDLQRQRDVSGAVGFRARHRFSASRRKLAACVIPARGAGVFVIGLSSTKSWIVPA